ncbi:amidase [Actinacidiphila oryziradicis]|uniref:Amidase n=1 Tax=Actinacidiphila oryziradicis TaxID=2571141 RepID=A0A4U0SC06_9ACTN|nr:amidase [Actinacidiphila oryziradicis]TJZ97864.1 amidase [Actinacidiphila oryziradicis]
MTPLSSITSLVDRWDAARGNYEALDSRVHAVISWIDSSREEAVELECERISGTHKGILHGLLVGVKDNIETAGVRTTAGASFLATNRPSHDAHAIELLRQEGAVVVAKLNMSELAMGATNQNLTYGMCRNPWDLHRIPGGSSGGSAAALAAQYCEAALGTDTGASVRVPASLNGVVGLRPTFGAISNRGVIPLARTQDTVGPMAHSARTVARLLDVLTGFDALDPYSTRWSGEPATARLGMDIRSLRIGLPESFFFDDVDAGVSEVIDRFLEFLRREGAEFISIPDFGQADASRHWNRIVLCEGFALHRDRLLRSPADFSADVYDRLAKGGTVNATDLVYSLEWRTDYRHRLHRILQNVDVIVSPVAPVDAPFADGIDSQTQTEALGRKTYPWALHDGPTMTLPIGFHPGSGMPVGIALVGGRWCESKLFQLADYYQRRTDWHERRPRLLEGPRPMK